MVEVMVGTMEVAGEVTTLDTPGDITVGRGEATVLGINILTESDACRLTG